MSKVFAALILAPLAAGAAFAACALLLPALSNLRITFPLLLGAAAYCAAHFLPLRAPRRRSARRGRYFYVLAHELSHAAAALLSGAKVRKIAVKGTGGYVSLDSGNAFISLAPYFIPFYAVAAGLLYSLAAFFWDMAPWRPWFTGLAGFLLAFHFVNTIGILAGPVQNDLRKAGGLFFSLALLTLLNALCLVLVLKLLFPGLISLRAYAARAQADTATLLRWLFAVVSYAFNTAKMYLTGK